jgi:hypothetical protein
VPLLRDGGDPTFADRVVFAELTSTSRRLIGARTPSRKYILRELPEQGMEVYDLQADPRERQNLTTPDLVAEGKTLVEQYRAQGTAALTEGPRPTAPEIDGRTAEKLRALGYVQ